MIPIKLTRSQYNILMNHPIHYNLNMQYFSKTDSYECYCTASEAKQIKQLVDGK